ncbi:MAG: hypothetical protein MUE72_11420 [Chitinophagaceae bacterium]|nr:hypothetical protein [Pyrinomonadaceae bacterium]MCU0323019.1 hypothetical protein [Chitinophagaceae bacterium]
MEEKTSEEIGEEIYNEGLNEKLLRFHKSKIIGKPRNKRDIKINELNIRKETPVTFRLTGKEKNIIQRLVAETGLSLNQVACYFMVVGMEKEFSKERDKFDMSRKVARTYQESLDKNFQKYQAELDSQLETKFYEMRETLLGELEGVKLEVKDEIHKSENLIRQETNIIFLSLKYIVNVVYHTWHFMSFLVEEKTIVTSSEFLESKFLFGYSGEEELNEYIMKNRIVEK